MRRLTIVISVVLICVNSYAQIIERNQVKQLPKFEVCESDERDKNACFETEFIKLLKQGYKDEELADDKVYQRQFEAYVEVDKKGRISIHDFSTKESRIFIPFVRAIQSFPKLKPALNPLERPVDLRFKIEVQLQRDKINVPKEVEVKINIDFMYDEESSEKFIVY